MSQIEGKSSNLIDSANRVKDLYYKVENQLEGTPKYDEFMNLLGSLDKSISDYLYNVLYEVPDYFYKYLNKGSDREEAESHILKMVIGDEMSDDVKCSINSLIDSYSKRIAELAKCGKSFSKAHTTRVGEILPPDREGFCGDTPNKYKNANNTVDNDAGLNDDFYVDKVLLLSSVLNDMGIDLENGIEKTSCDNNTESIRKYPYEAVYVRDMDVTVLINPGFGDDPGSHNTTFVFSGNKIPVGISKGQFVQEHSPISIKFYRDNISQWKKNIKEALRNCQKLEKKIEIVKSKFEDPVVRSDWFGRNTFNRRKFFIDLGNGLKITYVGIARLFLDSNDPEIDKLFDTKYLVFNDDNFCKISDIIFGNNDQYLNILRNRGEFVEILRSVYKKYENMPDVLYEKMSSSTAYKKFYNDIKKIFIDGVLNDDKIFLEIKNFIMKGLTDISESDFKYRDNFRSDLEKFLSSWFPKSFDGMIGLLGGSTDCLEGGYLCALFHSKHEGDEYLKKYELIRNNNDEFISFFRSVYNKDPGKFKELVSSCYSYKEKFEEIKEYFCNSFFSGGYLGCFNNIIETNGSLPNDEFKSFFELWIPKSLDGLIVKLGGNKKCLEGGYVWALLEGKGDEYYNKREYIAMNEENFISFFKKNIGKIEGYFSGYENYQNNYSEIKNKLIEGCNEDPEFLEGFCSWLPVSFKSLVRKLGGVKYCFEGGYVLALARGEGDGYLKNREKRKGKNK